jgi:DNA repair exonuclease SbcCD ATPase subunit
MAAATFGVKVDEETKNQWDSIIEQLALQGENKGDTMARVFKIVEDNMDSEKLRTGGADVQALDSALSHLRSMYVALVGGREELAASYEEKINKIKDAKDKAEVSFLEQIETLKFNLAEAEKKQAEAVQSAAAAMKDRDAAIQQSNSQKELADSTKRNNDMLVNEITELKENLNGYSELKSSEAKLKETLVSLERTLEDTQKESKRALKDAESEYKHALENALNTAALENQKVIAAKDKETNNSLREADKKIAKLEAQVELLQAQIMELKNIGTKTDTL